jgi:PAS domain S-box-containing protein
VSDAHRADRRTRLRTDAAAPAAVPEGRPEDPAVITGNLAGIVESANEAWTRITGFPLRETLDKPIAHFLDAAGIELDLVDFVGQQFMEGRSCTVEFPFRTFDAREIQVHLEVEPIHDPRGELIEFRAVAHDITQRRKLDLARDAAASSPSGEAGSNPSARIGRSGLDSHAGDAARSMATESRRLVSLDERVLNAFRRGLRPTETRTHFDLDLDPDLPLVETDPARFDELVEGLLELARHRVAGSWGWVSLLTGRTTPDRSHVSRVHPIVARLPQRLSEPHLYVEIHDSAPSATARLHDEDERARLAALAESLSLALHFDDTPGSGHQALVLIPLPSPHEA